MAVIALGSQSDFPLSLVPKFIITVNECVRPLGGGGVAPSALSLLLDDAHRHRLRRRFAHPGPPRSPHTLP